MREKWLVSYQKKTRHFFAFINSRSIQNTAKKHELSKEWITTKSSTTQNTKRKTNLTTENKLHMIINAFTFIMFIMFVVKHNYVYKNKDNNHLLAALESNI